MASNTTKRPFDVIVITSPDTQAATAAQELIISSCGNFSSTSTKTLADQNQNYDNYAPVVLQSNNGIIYISSCDPYGARMGSGGGTIAALAEADYAYQQHAIAMNDKNEEQSITKSDYPTVLICHAGGESSRCPTQIVLGKAWTSLPVMEEKQSAYITHDGSSSTLKNNGHSTTSVSNPTALLISSLSTIFEDIPKGSVVVAASDVLLSFNAESSSNSNHNQKINFDTITQGDNSHYNHVLGLAVPAPLSTAKNHGVFVLDSSTSDESEEEEWRIQKTHKVLQKPSISEMNSMSNPACTFCKDETSPQDVKESNAWIDTGVCTFLPHSAKTLRYLSESTLSCCTRLGLQEMYKEEQRQKNDYSGRVSLEQFVKTETQKICLYGDMLHALRTETNQTKTHEDEEFTTILDELSSKLSQHELYTCAVPAGSFVHLGTTKELADFLTMGATSSSTCGGEVDDDDRLDNVKEMQRYQHFGKALGLTSRADSFVSGFISNDTSNDGNIVVNSVLLSKSEQSSSLGSLSVVEHCHIECDGSIKIGEQAIVSGVRGSIKGDIFHIPDGICLQLLPLCQQNGDGESFVCTCTGVEDAIKDIPVKLYGVSLHLICEQYGISEDNLWDESIPVSKRMLWNAKIHPILTADEDGKLDYSFLDWVALVMTGGKSDELDTSDMSPAMLGLKQWKEAKRLSLSQIRQCVDSEAEARYRSSISSKRYEESRLVEVSEILLNRRHEPCNFNYVIDSVLSSSSTRELRYALQTLCNVASDALTNGQFDIVGRIFSTMALLIDDSFRNKDSLANDSSPAPDVDNPASLIEKTIDELKSSKIPQDTISSIHSICNESIDGSYEVKTDVAFLEKSASIMTERCLSGDAISSTYEQTTPLPVGVLTMASAPARIDLAGGWSDTPPISFEHGGSVACLAVLIDGKRPLKATCRTIKGGSGIKLRTESRSLDDESLLSSSEVMVHTLSDLADYNNPMAECALLKCVLIQLGLVSLDLVRADDNNCSIQPYLQKFCQQTDNVGLEIVSQSLLPQGSGMGSSSILAGCILAAVVKCVGIQLTGGGDSIIPSNQVQVNDSSSLIHAVLMVEQLLTTGGGWQDNIGGLVGGLKLGSSDAHVLPLQTKVQRFDLSSELVDELNQRLCLVFSGKPRLAKNILSNVLRRWARRSEEIRTTVDGLVKGATEAIESIQAQDLDRLGRVMSQYWQYKIAMAGEDSGVEPSSVHSVLELLSSSRDIVGGTLCGAGGGGFLVMLASKGRTSEDIEATVTNSMNNGNNMGFDSFSWHKCTVSNDGMVVNVVELE